MSRHPHLVHVDELPFEAHTGPGGFAAERKRLAAAAGGRALGASLYFVQPGHAAFPRHRHHANEEAVFVLDGVGVLRLGDEELPLRAGTWVSLPAGGPPHQVVATDAALTYLVVSTMLQPEVLEYPDSGKIGVLAGAAPGASTATRGVRAFFREAAAVPYWDGEG